MTYAELEIGVHRPQGEAYRVELRFTNPESDAEVPPVQGGCGLDPSQLIPLQGVPGKDYGRALTAQVFEDDSIRSMFARVKAAIESAGLYMRLRLFVGPTAPDLHGLYWELLRDPETDTPLATSEKILFSRFLASRDWRPVRLRPKSKLRALVAVASPENLSDYRLADVDAAGEVERARRSLAGIDVEVLGERGRVTLDRLIDGIRGGVDILYLVAHGALVKRIPRVFLEDDQGQVNVVDGNQLALRLSELPEAPRLIVLASCEGAGTGMTASSPGEPPILASLGARLVESGVAAVVAMQGKISMETVEKAMPVFFEQLLEDGQIDRAMATARGKVRAQTDSWMPALFLRLRGGRIWYEPHFAGEGSDFAKWKSICRRVRLGKFMPIIGPDIGDAVCGTRRELAHRLADAEGFPLAEHDRSDLAKVTQYLSISQDRDYARGAVTRQLATQVLNRNGALFGEDACTRSLPQLLKEASAHHRRSESDPYRILAELGARIYISASPLPLTYHALKDCPDRNPTIIRSRWRPTTDSSPHTTPVEGVPTREAPIVFHIFGDFGDPESLVLTEDDYFDYLIRASRYSLVPTVVSGSLTESTLLFLGFRLDGWVFRVLFRLIMTLEGCEDLKQYSHVGVQVDPEDHSFADVERAREYVEGYFGKPDRRAGSRGSGEPQIDIYWGSAADFLNELRRQLANTADEELVQAGAEETADGWY